MATKITLARRKRKSGALFDDKRDASMLTLSANKAAAAGDWVSAVVDRFRAIIRSLDERALLEDYPGMTAQEARSAWGPGNAKPKRELCLRR